jgi:hypothetical protein
MILKCLVLSKTKLFFLFGGGENMEPNMPNIHIPVVFNPNGTVFNAKNVHHLDGHGRQRFVS